jgi:DNA-binding transcriptional LysR family regulator
VSGDLNYANLRSGATSGAAPYHVGPALAALDQRTELIRVEVDAGGNEVAGTLQVLAELAVDFELGATYETVAPPVGPSPVVIREPVGDTGSVARYTIGGPPTAGGANPDLIRSIQVRLSTRAEQADRDRGLAVIGDPYPYRFNLGPTVGWARMRTLVADIQLPNQATRITP